MRNIRFGSRSFFFILFSTLLALSVGVEAQRQPSPRRAAAERQDGAGRIAPPARINCPRDHLTSYNGRILFFQRRTGRTVISVRTDWDTTERVVIRHPRTDNPARWFLLRGEPFRPRDWRLIEASRNRLLPNARANIWVCDNGSNPIVDWQPTDADRVSLGN